MESVKAAEAESQARRQEALDMERAMKASLVDDKRVRERVEKEREIIYVGDSLSLVF